MTDLPRTQTERRKVRQRENYERTRGPRRLAVPAPRAHAAADGTFQPYDADGAILPSEGPGVPVLGHAYCRCGAASPPLYTSRERRLWHTEHREQLAGVTWA